MKVNLNQRLVEKFYYAFEIFTGLNGSNVSVALRCPLQKLIANDLMVARIVKIIYIGHSFIELGINPFSYFSASIRKIT